ncbi:hypothetical protein AB0G74_33895 [Streptomyces sp. NPDC020875]|uniref:hypothetical protein n=1 Tax=Streptomyces sp. NPDC020875 TaxID=3154898 RepID=UPI00340A712D
MRNTPRRADDRTVADLRYATRTAALALRETAAAIETGNPVDPARLYALARRLDDVAPPAAPAFACTAVTRRRPCSSPAVVRLTTTTTTVDACDRCGPQLSALYPAAGVEPLPGGRFAIVEEVAAAARYLLDRHAAPRHGECILCPGGDNGLVPLEPRPQCVVPECPRRLVVRITPPGDADPVYSCDGHVPGVLAVYPDADAAPDPSALDRDVLRLDLGHLRYLARVTVEEHQAHAQPVSTCVVCDPRLYGLT